MEKILKFIVLIMILAVIIIPMLFNLTKLKKKKMLYITLFFYSIWSTFIYWIDISFQTTFISNWKLKKNISGLKYFYRLVKAEMKIMLLCLCFANIYIFLYFIKKGNNLVSLLFIEFVLFNTLTFSDENIELKMDNKNKSNTTDVVVDDNSKLKNLIKMVVSIVVIAIGVYVFKNGIHFPDTSSGNDGNDIPFEKREKPSHAEEDSSDWEPFSKKAMEEHDYWHRFTEDKSNPAVNMPEEASKKKKHTFFW